jgi:microcystin-dependent protein
VDFFLGQIIMTLFDYAPPGFLFCDGSLLSIYQYQALYTLLGARYGGDGVTTFALPDLRGRFALGSGPGTGGIQPVLGQFGGAASATLNLSQLPITLAADAATTASSSAFAIGATPVPSPVSTMPPFCTINFLICVDGIYPPRS